MEFDFDLFIIGGGSGGVRSGRMAAQKGARVAIAEQDRFGGTCVVRGCIPKKLLVFASHYSDEFADSAGFGWTLGERSFDWQTLIANKDKEIARLEGLYRNAVESAGARVFADRAVLKNANTVHLVNAKTEVTAKTILIATGGKPVRDLDGLPGAEPGIEHCITSEEAFHLKEFPKRIIVVGGGYIALEFAHIFHGLGAQVTLAYRGPKILRGFEEDMRDALQDSMRKKGIRLMLDTGIRVCEKSGKEIRAFTTGGETLVADQVMLAIGRIPNTTGVGLEEAGVVLNKKGAVVVDLYSRTSVENIYAVGDVTARKELTPVALHEAMCFVKTVFDGVPTAPDHELVASAVFTTPEIGTVGLSEAQALALGHSIDVYKSSFRPLKHTLSGRDLRMLMKLVVDAETDKVLGCHIFGPEAGELVQLVAIALKMGATKSAFDATVAVHPTMAEELVTMRTKSYSKSPA